MIGNILSLGNKIEMQEISGLKSDFDEKKRMYVSQILEFDDDDDDLVNIAMPIFEGKLIPIDIGVKYDMYFYTKKGIYTCEAEAVNRYKSDKIYVLVMRLLSDLKKFQRRQFFRLEKNMEFQYKLFTQEDEKYFRLMGKISDEMDDRIYESGVSLDLSGGGMRFVSKNKFNVGDKMIVRLAINTGTALKVCEPIAKVISSVHAKGRSDLYENRIEFVQIKEGEREALIKYIFTQERIVRKKQLE